MKPENKVKNVKENSKKGGEGTNTPPVRNDYKPILSPKLAEKTTETAAQPPSIDLSALSLPDNFKSLSDGLKLIPPGIRWAYFANLKQGTGIESRAVPGTNFYGIPIIGMLNSEYYDGSWVELHDVGKTAINVKSNPGEKTDNIVDNGTIPLQKYNELKDSSTNRGFKSYEVNKENNTLIIRMTSNLDNVISEATQNYGIEI